MRNVLRVRVNFPAAKMRGRKMIRNLVNTYQLLSARGREERRRSPEGGRYAPEGPRRVQRGREGPHHVHLVAERGRDGALEAPFLLHAALFLRPYTRVAVH